MQEGGVPGQCGVRAAWPAEHVLCSAPLMHAPLEPSLAVHSIREVRFCKREVPGLERRCVENVEDVGDDEGDEVTLRVLPRW
jgi:hypothetical protein